MTMIEIPPAWEALETARLRGTLMVVGAPDAGKSTFAQYLYQRLCAEVALAAYLDGDPGQSTLGPPAAMSLALGLKGEANFPPRGRRWRSFVGAVSPAGHMLPVVVGAARLVQAAREAGAEAIIYDTSGMVDPERGGAALKLAKIDLLRPSVIFAIQRERELEPWLIPLRRSRRVRVIDLPRSPAAGQRDTAARQTHRARQFASYFRAARPVRVDWRRLAVFPAPRFRLDQLAALEDVQGFALGLGLVQESDSRARQVTLYTPLEALTRVDALRLGDLVLDPQSFRDQRLVQERRA